ncbi:GNAT family N-acetyltransferase [Nocardia stercoris]|uniref:GNAT family N-acetyltransferase n=1 Tax=Nocardia stercoris TaxID=2483361 RepID=A0A3M2L791_9NOCA|nr:GNAT family N-acetyltransferase [Nocardia stercoris]RMI33387.1 GNAT family N-acetyltransferase [Nocardia stercoris]
MTVGDQQIRRAVVDDARAAARLLDDFNREFDTPTPGVEALTARLTTLLAGDAIVVLLCGEPAVGIAVLSFRPNVWFDGPVALLDELYIQPDLRRCGLGNRLLETAIGVARAHGAGTLEINVDGEDTDARRFYEAHGFSNTEPGATEPMYFYYRDLD